MKKCWTKLVVFDELLEHVLRIDRGKNSAVCRLELTKTMIVYNSPPTNLDGFLFLSSNQVLRQPMGHLLLCGDAGAGKTVLTKFVSWMNGLNVFQIKAHSKYDIEDFYENLREVMKRVSLKQERITFIFDEANALSSAFIEAMNALLASGEIPGLFEGDEYTALINSCRDSAMRDGVILDSEEELWRRFTALVQRNLHGTYFCVRALVFCTSSSLCSLL